LQFPLFFSPRVFDAEHDEVVVVGVEDDAVRPGEVVISGGGDPLHRDGVVDIPADYVEFPRVDRDDNVAMCREAADRQLVIGNRSPAAPVADQIAALGCVNLDPLCRQRDAGSMPSSWRRAALM